uniref:Uncharacterized protein n=1 Tax=Lactuca sativa TaxID=4236 RepID=A0A9R1UPD7_LACSA|nr:hypothetical protein LSAT_V11C800441760 [Lactuca sativa]
MKVYNYLMPNLAGQFQMMGSTRVLLMVPKSSCRLLMLFIDLQQITSHSNVKIHVILLKVYWQYAMKRMRIDKDIARFVIGM